MPRGRKKKSENETSNTELAADNSIGPIDTHVGARICARRKLLQLSQKEMAEKLGITFQQVQKYEKGVNRIGAGRLFSIAQILGVDIDYFYGDVKVKDYSNMLIHDQGSDMGFLNEDSVEQKFDPMHGTEAMLLLKAFYSMPSKARAALLEMMTSLKDRDDTPTNSES